MSPDAYALNEEMKKLLIERNKLKARLVRISAFADELMAVSCSYYGGSDYDDGKVVGKNDAGEELKSILEQPL